jgi:MFS family permease
MKNGIFVTKPKADVLKGSAAFLFIVLFVFLGLYRVQPPRAVPATAPLAEFSAERAMVYIESIAQKPHPQGSLEQKRVREYILSEFAAIGLEPQMQETQVQEETPVFQVASQLPSVFGMAANVNNIVVRLKGTDNTKAILIAGHYDSVTTSLNASDGGSSVAVALEVARALKAGPSLKNDVIFLLTNCEEDLLLGARAFARQHPWAKDVGVVLHFIARGTSGPSIMFETTPENGWLIQEFAKAAPHPVANSLAYEVYQILENDTDFSQYRISGLSGFNFAYINRAANYHTMLDNPENLDLASLQHHGSQALALARHFGNLDLENVKKANRVYFDLWSLVVVHYPETWVTPLAFLVALVYLGVIVFGLRKKRLTFLGIVLGVLALLLITFVAYVVVFLLVGATLSLHNHYKLILFGSLYNGHLYLASFVFLTVAIALTLYVLFRKKVRLQGLVAGGLTVWLLLALWSSFSLPGASYLFVWPLLFDLLAFGGTLALESDESISWSQLGLFSLGAIPGLVLLVPTTFLVSLALPPLTMGSIAVTILVLLQLGALVPHLTLMTRPKAWLLPAVMAVVGVGFMAAANLTAGFSVDHPRPNLIHYGFDADTGEAMWIGAQVYGNGPDEWTSQFFPDGAIQDPLYEFMPFGYGTPDVDTPLMGPAPVVPVSVPEVALLDDDVGNGVRKIHLGITFPEPAIVLRAHIPINSEQVVSAKLGGMDADLKIEPKDKWISIEMYNYLPSRKGFEFFLETTSSEPVEVIAVSISYGLPQASTLSIDPRPANMIPSPIWASLSDCTLVRKSFEFPIP